MSDLRLNRLVAVLVCAGIVAGAIGNCHAEWDLELHIVIDARP